MNKRTKLFSSIVLFLLIATLGFAVLHAGDFAQAQTPYNTPTADVTGRIVYIVQPGEFCSQIQERTGVCG